jgi:hypothetical protein
MAEITIIVGRDANDDYKVVEDDDNGRDDLDQWVRHDARHPVVRYRQTINRPDTNATTILPPTTASIETA